MNLYKNICLRRLKRQLIKQKDREIIAVHRAAHALDFQRKNLGWEELNPPIRKGYVKHFVLRADIMASPNAELYQKILNIIQDSIYSQNRDFTRKDRSGAKYKKRVVKFCQLKTLSEGEWRKLPTKEQNCFYRRERLKKNKNKQSILVIDYVFCFPWAFEEKIEPHYIRKVRKRDEELEAEIKELDNYLNLKNPDYQIRFYWLKGYSQKDDWNDKRIRRGIYEKELDKELRQFWKYGEQNDENFAYFAS